MNIAYRGGFVFVDGSRYACSKKAEDIVSDSKNQREYVERIEFLAYEVFDAKIRPNDGLFYKFELIASEGNPV